MLKWIWRTLVFSVGLIVAWSIYRFIILRTGPFHWDEAAHSLKGLLIAHDIRTGDWLSFLYDTYKQVYWPPLHSWLVAIPFLFVQPSPVLARSVTLVCYLLAALVIYLAGLQFRQRNREVAASVAALLFLTSPLVIAFSAQVMLEIPGVLFISLTVLIYIWLHSEPHSDRSHAWLGIAIICAYFTRTNYGVLLVLVWLLCVYFGGGIRAVFSRSSFYAMLPVAISLTIWFLYPPKIRSTIVALINIPWGMQHPYSLAGILFYPNLVLHFFGSAWQGLLPIGAFALAFRYWKNPGVRFVLLLGACQLGLGIAHHQRTDRHMIAMVPAVTLAAGFIGAEYWSAWPGLIERWLPRTVTIAVCVTNLALFPWFLHPGKTGPESEAPDRIAAAAKAHKSTLILGTREIRHPSPPCLDWRLIVDAKLMPITNSGVTMNFEEDRKIWRIARGLPMPSPVKSELKRVTSRGDAPAKLRSIYLGLVQELQLTPPYSAAGNLEKARAIVRSMDAADPFEVIYVFASARPQSDYPFEFIDEAIKPLGFEHVLTEAFVGTNDRGDLYRRTETGPDSP